MVRVLRKRVLALGVVALLNPLQANSEQPAAAYYTPEQSAAILEKTGELRLAPDLGHLSAREWASLDLLLEVGQIMHDLYLQSRHHQALEQRAALARLERENSEDLAKLFRVFRGPILTDLDNQRVAFLPVDPEAKGKNVYPLGVTREDMEAFFRAYPEQRDSVLHLRSVVRANTAASRAADLATLDRHPVLDGLYPRLRSRLVALARRQGGFYGLPYAVAYAEQLVRAHDLLLQASETVAPDDPDFADFLALRARDLLTSNYEGGDAAWVRGRFNKLNAELGSYETYDDALYGIKSFFAVSLLVRDVERSEALASAVGDLQALENSLPYDHQKSVSSDIPVGVYNVVADFGQARGTNTATILPNESHIARKYGRTIMLRYNIQTAPQIFANTKQAWDAVVAPGFRNHLTLESAFQRTLWHEIGHYLGPSVDKRNRSLDIALADNTNLYEEMKADLVSLYAVEFLAERGYYSEQQKRGVYASGVLRTLRSNRPRREQPYGTMQLMSFNYFLESGVLRFDREAGELHINYAAYPAAVSSLLAALLDIQYQGDKAASDAFVERYAGWDEDLHGVIAARLRNARSVRYWLVRYAALGE
jgi:hypothetical protein